MIEWLVRYKELTVKQIECLERGDVDDALQLMGEKEKTFAQMVACARPEVTKVSGGCASSLDVPVGVSSDSCASSPGELAGDAGGPSSSGSSEVPVFGDPGPLLQEILSLNAEVVARMRQQQAQVKQELQKIQKGRQMQAAYNAAHVADAYFFDRKK